MRVQVVFFLLLSYYHIYFIHGSCYSIHICCLCDSYSTNQLLVILFRVFFLLAAALIFLLLLFLLSLLLFLILYTRIHSLVRTFGFQLRSRRKRRAVWIGTSIIFQPKSYVYVGESIQIFSTISINSSSPSIELFVD